MSEPVETAAFYDVVEVVRVLLASMGWKVETAALMADGLHLHAREVETLPGL